MSEQQNKPPLPDDLQPQINVLNLRIANFNLSNADLLHEMDMTIKQMLLKLSALEQENAELKNKYEPTSKKPKTQ